jgi:Protein of unknown function (DUF2569)
MRRRSRSSNEAGFAPEAGGEANLRPERDGHRGRLGLLWLSLVFLIPGTTAFIASKLYSRPGLAALPDEVFRSLEIVEWTVVAATAGLCWFLAWRLSHREVWRSVEIVIAGLWVNAVAITLAEFVGLSIATGLPLFFLIEAGWASLARPVVIAVIWTAYLLRSKRVGRTYRRRVPPARSPPRSIEALSPFACAREGLDPAHSPGGR